MVSQKYDVYHVIIEQGNYASTHGQRVRDSWEKVLPKDKIISIDDYTRLPEALVSVLQVREGADPTSVIAGWTGKTAKTVEKAIKHVKSAFIKLGPPLKLKSTNFKLKPKASPGAP